MTRLLTDASFLISSIRTCDRHHQPCYQYFKDHEDSTWVVPTIAYFEYQATQSRLRQEGKKAYRELYIPNIEVYEISHELIQKVSSLDLANLFERLRGADLVYACIAKVEGIPLITCDGDFDAYAHHGPRQHRVAFGGRAFARSCLA
jgi:predicted nucleic acid-binding protein